MTYFLAMALLPVVLFLTAVLLPSFPTEGKVRLKSKIFPELFGIGKSEKWRVGKVSVWYITEYPLIAQRT